MNGELQLLLKYIKQGQPNNKNETGWEVKW